MRVRKSFSAGKGTMRIDDDGLRPWEVATELPGPCQEYRNQIRQMVNHWEQRLKAHLAEYVEPFVAQVEPRQQDLLRMILVGMHWETILELHRRMKHFKTLEHILSSKHEAGRLPIEAAKSYPLLHLCEQRGMTLRTVGNRYQGRCIFHHDKEPSFFVFPDNHWFCFSCQKGGDPIDFLVASSNYAFPDAVRFLAGGN